MTLLTPASPALAALETALAEAAGPDGPFAPAALTRLDQLEEFPVDAYRALDELGLADHYVPARLGGELVDHLGSSLLVRAVARRDLTVAIAHAKTFLGAVSVWLAGTESQCRWLAHEIRARRLVAWGLTERDHGSDLFACELTATAHDDTWRLDGEKWLINNATRAELVCVLARTRPRGGPLGFSLFLVDKRRLESSAYRCLPKVRTHGIRGADISGIAFTEATVPAGALVGDVGRGLHVVLESLQLTRTVCTVLSLGAADHAMSIAVESTRRQARSTPRILGEAAALRLLAEATAIVALRGVEAFPEEMSVIAAVAKGFVPTAVDLLLGRLGSLMGASAFVVDPSPEGAFEKLERDHRIVALFDGSTAVCQAALIAQFPTLAEGYGDAAADVTGWRRRPVWPVPCPSSTRRRSGSPHRAARCLPHSPRCSPSCAGSRPAVSCRGECWRWRSPSNRRAPTCTASWARWSRPSGRSRPRTLRSLADTSSASRPRHA